MQLMKSDTSVLCSWVHLAIYSCSWACTSLPFGWSSPGSNVNNHLYSSGTEFTPHPMTTNRFVGFRHFLNVWWEKRPSVNVTSFLGRSLLLLFSHSLMSSSLRPRGLQHPRFPVLHHLPELAQTHIHWVGDAIQKSNPLILCHSLLLLPSIFPINRVFSNESALHIRWPKYWSFSISPSNEYSELISFRID